MWSNTAVPSVQRFIYLMSCILEEEKTPGQALLKFVFFLFGDKNCCLVNYFDTELKKEVKLIRKRFVDVYKKGVFDC